MLPIFDAHLDLAWNALSFDRDLNLEVEHLRRAEEGMIDEPSRGGCTVTFPELRAANVRVCVATILARSGQVPAIRATIPRTDLDFATDEIAYATARGQLAYYRMLEAKGVIRIIETAEDLTHHWGGWADADSPLGVILSMEGADPLAPPMGPEAWSQAIVEREGLVQLSDEGALQATVSEVIEASPDQVAAYRGGKKAAIGWFVGQVMKKTEGKANPKVVNALLRKALDI